MNFQLKKKSLNEQRKISWDKILRYSPFLGVIVLAIVVLWLDSKFVSEEELQKHIETHDRQYAKDKKDVIDFINKHEERLDILEDNHIEFKMERVTITGHYEALNRRVEKKISILNEHADHINELENNLIRLEK